MAADPEVFSNKPDKEDDFFVVEEEPDTGEEFEPATLYSADEFLRILRMTMRRYMDDPQYAPMIDIMEHWERRVTHYVTAHPEDKKYVKAGLVLCEDNVLRMNITLDLTDLLR